jgi:adenine-specific DNA-methyltransferase
MNSDLPMSDGLLKKIGAANLFMVFGEPDIEVKKLKDGELPVELRGLDVYDPTTQEVRNSLDEGCGVWFGVLVGRYGL